jgi:hypothetical protein
MSEGFSPPPGPAVIGWKEYVGLPEWGLTRVRAKVDTGARTSALDVAHYDLVELPGRGLVARLLLAVRRKKKPAPSLIEAPVLKIVVVTNSNGMREQRPVVETVAQLGRFSKTIRFTLTNRAGMRYRVILGRAALAGDFVVDVSKKYLLNT